MTSFPFLLTLILLPLVGAAFTLCIRGDAALVCRNVRAAAVFVSASTFLFSLLVLTIFDTGHDGFQLVERYDWIGPQMAFRLGVDGVSVAFILLTTFVTPLAIVSATSSITVRTPEFMALFLVLESVMIGTFCALDFISFYVFFEATLIPMYLIIGIWGGVRRIYASMKFFLYTFLGSVLMLVGILVVGNHVGDTSFVAAYDNLLPPDAQKWVWLLFFASFAVKMPMWPVHTWLPDAHVEAPTAGSVVLAAILLKMGGYGFYRLSLPLFPDGMVYFAPFVYTISVIAVIYTSLVALVQTDMKKLIAYSSIAHMGFVTFGLFSPTLQGVSGAIVQMISHGFISAALFLCVGVLYDRTHSRDIAHYGGIARVMPVFAAVFLISILGGIGLPGTVGFVGEILVLVASFQIGFFWTIGLGMGLILGAAYALGLYRRVMLGKITNPDHYKLLDLTYIEKSALIPLVGVSLFFGFYPAPLLSLIEPSVQKTRAQYERPVSDQPSDFDVSLSNHF